jgi:uncharacterized protein Usg
MHGWKPGVQIKDYFTVHCNKKVWCKFCWQYGKRIHNMKRMCRWPVRLLCNMLKVSFTILSGFLSIQYAKGSSDIADDFPCMNKFIKWYVHMSSKGPLIFVGFNRSHRMIQPPHYQHLRPQQHTGILTSNVEHVTNGGVNIILQGKI